MLTEDITTAIGAQFSEPDRAAALELVRAACLHDGQPADTRCQRCAVVAARGSLEQLRYYVDLLRIDFRDVIVAGEYEVWDQTLVHVRDLSRPIEDASA